MSKNHEFLEQVKHLIVISAISKMLKKKNGTPSTFNVLPRYETRASRAAGGNFIYPRQTLLQMAEILHGLASQLLEISERFRAAFENYDLFVKEGAEIAFLAYRQKKDKK
jgi:hypothetical protein